MSSVRSLGTAGRNRRLASLNLFSSEIGWRVGAPLIVAAATIALLVAVTASVQVTYADRIPAGVQVMGVDVGGLTKIEARGLLHAETAALLRQSVTLRADSREWDSTARELGARLDADSMLEQAYGIGHEGNPLQRAAAQWSALAFGRLLRGPALDFDASQPELALRRVAGEFDRPPQDARIELVRSSEGVSVVIVPAQPGVRLLMAESADRVRRAVAQGLPAVVDLPVENESPSVMAADLEGARAQAQRMIAAPVVLTFQDRRWTIGREDIARMLVFDRTSARLVQVSLRPEVLSDTWARIAREVDQPALNARFEWDSGGLRLIRESQDGRQLSLEGLKAQLPERLLSDERTVPLPVVLSRPMVASSDGPKLAIKELIKEGRTEFPGAVQEKQHNIRLAASRIHGTVVPPAGTFSFNREAGPTTLDAGFKTGWGITLSSAGARTIPSVAGGICQVATTLFHPVFHAGYAIEERHSHLYWIQSYGQPPLGLKGLDATVDEDYGVDFQFINTTSDPLLIQARVEGTTLIFGLYGTKPSWDVRIEGPLVTSVVPADRKQVIQREPTMPTGRSLQVEAAQDGFDVTITRSVTQGDDVRTLPLKSHYVPSRNVVLQGTGGAQEDPRP